MASIKRGDTWPPLRGIAADEEGLIDMTTADYAKVIMKSGATTVQGTVTTVAPPGDSDGFNWSYPWKAGDTAVVGRYSVEIEIHWDDGASPPQVETVPNGENPTLDIVQDNG